MRSFTVSSFMLRCRVCEGEGLYTALNVIDCSGTPRMRSSKATQTPADLPDLTNPQSNAKIFDKDSDQSDLSSILGIYLLHGLARIP